FALTPEKADTITAGVVLQPSFIPGLRLSADWYQIKIADAVTTLGGNRIVEFCHDYDLFCDRITFAPGSNQMDITFLDARQVNLAKLEVRGFDFEASYVMDLADIDRGWDGALSLRLLANHQYDFISQADPTTPELNYAGQSGPVGDGGDFNPSPPWIWNAFVTYDNGGFNVTGSWRRFSQGVYNIQRIGPEDAGYDPGIQNSISSNRVEGASYFGLAMSYRIPLASRSDTQYVELFGAIDNLFDKQPPIAPGGGGGGGSNYPTNPVFFDTFGSRFRAGVRVRY